MGAAGMVLLVACANAGSLQLARARSRQNELGMRFSLGASRARIIRQLLVESALLGLLAGLTPLLLTWGFTKSLAIQFAVTLPADQGTMVFHVAPRRRNDCLRYRYLVTGRFGIWSSSGTGEFPGRHGFRVESPFRDFFDSEPPAAESPRSAPSGCIIRAHGLWQHVPAQRDSVGEGRYRL